MSFALEISIVLLNYENKYIIELFALHCPNWIEAFAICEYLLAKKNYIIMI